MALFSREYLQKQRRYFDIHKEASIMEEEMDFKVYVDWIVDTELDRTNVTAATAQRLKERMNLCKCLLFATSENQPKSKWMPWELGYFDGMKEKVAILPIVEKENSQNLYSGQEYLGLYPYITYQKDTNKNDRLWVRTDERTYVELREWLSGKLPHNH